MCRMQYVLALVALYVGLAHSFSWDIAAILNNEIKFYFNGTHTHSETITPGDINLIIYDAVGNRMFFADRENTDTAIFSYDISTKKIESVIPKAFETVKITAIAYDPGEEIIFWSECAGIWWFSLKPGFDNNVYGHLLMEITPTEPTWIYALAVDSCGGYIYWTNINWNQSITFKIERARFDGSQREVIQSNLQRSYSMFIDQQTQRLYWTEFIDSNFGSVDSQIFFIESADLNGKNRTTFYSETRDNLAMSLAVSKDSVYWVDVYKPAVYQLSKNLSIHAKPKETSINPWGLIVTNYTIDDQFRGIQDCDGLKRLLPNNSVTEDNVSLNISSEVSLLCVHGMIVSGKSQCECTHGYTGVRCEVSVCQNYCFQGDCIVSANEQPTCRCKAGYSGERCEVNVCWGYCLNDGICSLNEDSEPVCQCKGHYEGERCDVSTCLKKCLQWCGAL